jgi:hypothetical protein
LVLDWRLWQGQRWEKERREAELLGVSVPDWWMARDCPERL